MAFDTKPNLTDGKFEQSQSDSLHLSGCTHIYGEFQVQSGGTISILSNAGVGKVLTSDSGGTGTWQNISTSTASGENITKQITQVSHGFNVKDVIGWSGGTYNKPIADGTYDGEVLGIVSKCFNADCFNLTQAGYITGLTSLSVNTTYFLSDITAGLLTSIEPTGDTHISKAVLIADSSTSGWVLPYAGYIITSGSSGGGTWGTITGTLSGQTDLQDALNLKLNTSLFSTYTGTTVPNNYYNKTQIDAYTGTTVPNNYYNKAEIDAYTGKTYSLSSPATKTVGGVTVGDTLTGNTAFQLLQKILAPELFPTSLVAPSTSISMSPSTSQYEIGDVIATLNVTGTFNCGSISPQYCSASSCRSGLANCYVFTGCQVVGSYVCTGSSVTKPATTYVICASQTWTVCTCYDAGVQPKGSAGTNYLSPLSAGATGAASCTITGIYPYYYGKLTGNTRPAVTDSLVTIGCLGKVVGISTGTVTVSFGSGASEYTWLAIPQTSASRVKWWISDLDCGFVSRGVPSDKYPDECQICITSAEACWSDVCYKIYMSGGVGEISAPMQFRLY